VSAVSSQHPIDERLEQLEEIETRVTIVEQRLDAIARNLDQIEQATLGPEESSQKYEREPLVDLLEDVRATAELAKATATSRAAADGGQQRTKTEVALEISRDELVRQTLVGESGSITDVKGGEKHRVGASLEVSDVRTMARPETDLAYKTVNEDAWGKLTKRWPCFSVKDDPKRIVVDPDGITPELARLVEDSLGRDDLANQVVVGDSSSGGGSR
jgi:hypothetical protein